MTADTITPNLLVEQLRQGSEVAFNRLYDLYSEPIYINILKMVKDEDIAKELLQDLFLKIWTIREQLDPQKSFVAFLYRIGRNLVNNLYKRAAHERSIRKQIAYASTELYNPVEESTDSEHNSKILQQAVESLAPKRKNIYILCKIEGKSYEEVS